MGQPAAKAGDRVFAADTHIVLLPGPPPASVALAHPFAGMLNAGLSGDVKIMGKPAATVGSTADNLPPHVPLVPGAFLKPPSNKAVVLVGSATVKINGKPAARNGDTALTCNDPVDLPIGRVVAVGTVSIG